MLTLFDLVPQTEFRGEQRDPPSEKGAQGKVLGKKKKLTTTLLESLDVICVYLCSPKGLYAFMLTVMYVQNQKQCRRGAHSVLTFLAPCCPAFLKACILGMKFGYIAHPGWGLID